MSKSDLTTTVHLILKITKIIFIQVNKVLLCLSHNIECPSGYFGMACSARCIGYCSGYEPCDHVIGMCPGGCQEGYTGQYCNKCKSKKLLCSQKQNY